MTITKEMSFLNYLIISKRTAQIIKGGKAVMLNSQYKIQLKYHLFMMQAKLKRRIRAQSKHRPLHPKNIQQPPWTSKLALRKLSLSFYGEETLRNNKQIIFDNCDSIQETSVIPLCITESCIKFKSSVRTKSSVNCAKQKESSLKMEKYFVGEKCDQIDLVPTNASHFQNINCSSSVGKKQKPRASSVKCKELSHEKKLQRNLGLISKTRLKSSCRVKKQEKSSKPSVR